MWEFKFYSRGGQGAVTAAKLLISAAILEGQFGQAIPSYGQERKGAPVFTYARIAGRQIDTKSYVYHPNCVLCFAPDLAELGIDIGAGATPDAILVVNQPVPRGDPRFARVVSIDADRITHTLLGEAPPNVAMLGALAKATGCVRLESLLKAIRMKIPGKAGEQNATACAAAYEAA